MEIDDSVLWSRARTGDSEAFGMLFERHGRTIYNYCFRRIGNWATAEDLVSIVFLQAWRRLDKPLPRGKELPWLLGIATNVVRNRRRAERRHAAALKRVPQPNPDPSFADDSDGRVDDEEVIGAPSHCWHDFPVASRRFLRSAPGPSSATRTPRWHCGYRSGPFGLGSRALGRACRNSILVSDMKRAGCK